MDNRLLESQLQMFGNDGGQFINNASGTVTSAFCAIQVTSDCVITTTGNLALSGVSISEGQIIYGRFESVAVASGEVIAYNRVEL